MDYDFCEDDLKKAKVALMTSDKSNLKLEIFVFLLKRMRC